MSFRINPIAHNLNLENILNLFNKRLKLTFIWINLSSENQISYNDWLGLYDMYPSCVKKDYSIDLSYINDNNSFITFLYIGILI